MTLLSAIRNLFSDSLIKHVPWEEEERPVPGPERPFNSGMDNQAMSSSVDDTRARLTAFEERLSVINSLGSTR